MISFGQQRIRPFICACTLLLVLAGSGAFSCAQEKERKDVEYLNERGLIDVHAHIGHFSGYDLSLENLLTNISENKIEYAFISNIDGAAIPGVTANRDEVTINKETAEVVAKHKQLKPLAWAKPGSEGASANNIEPFLRDKKFLGIKFHPDFNSFAANAAVVLPYLRLCEKYRVPAIFHCGRSPRSNAKAIYEVAKQFPNTPFILYHMGFGSSHEEAIEVARMAKMKKDALIYLETAQTEAEDVINAVKQVGAEQLLFGTDATYYGRYHYQHYLPMLRALKQAVSASEFELITHGNAVRLFHLEAGQPSQASH
ncbi:MAG: TatD family hydrolase [Acidobacteriota bacterium]